MPRKNLNNPTEDGPQLRPTVRGYQYRPAVQGPTPPRVSNQTLRSLANFSSTLTRFLDNKHGRDEDEAERIARLEYEKADANQKKLLINGELKKYVEDGTLSKAQLPLFKERVEFLHGEELVDTAYSDAVWKQLANVKTSDEVEQILAEAWETTTKDVNLDQTSRFYEGFINRKDQVDQQFRTAARRKILQEEEAEGDRVLANKGADVVGLLVNTATTQDRAAAITKLDQYVNLLRQTRSNGEVAVFLTNKLLTAQVDTLLASEDFDEARDLIETFENYKIDGSNGVLGKVGTTRLTIEGLYANIDQREVSQGNTRRKDIEHETYDLLADIDNKISSIEDPETLSPYDLEQLRETLTTSPGLSGTAKRAGLAHFDNWVKGELKDQAEVVAWYTNNPMEWERGDLLQDPRVSPETASRLLKEQSNNNRYAQYLPVNLRQELENSLLQKDIAGPGTGLSTTSENPEFIAAFNALSDETKRAQAAELTAELRGEVIQSWQALVRQTIQDEGTPTQEMARNLVEEVKQVATKRLEQRVLTKHREALQSQGTRLQERIQWKQGIPNRQLKNAVDALKRSRVKPTGRRGRTARLLPVDDPQVLKLLAEQIPAEGVRTSRRPSAEDRTYNRAVREAEEAYYLAKAQYGFTVAELSQAETTEGISFDPSQLNPLHTPIFDSVSQLEELWNGGQYGDLFAQVVESTNSSRLTDVEIYNAQKALLMARPPIQPTND